MAVFCACSNINKYARFEFEKTKTNKINKLTTSTHRFTQCIEIKRSWRMLRGSLSCKSLRSQVDDAAIRGASLCAQIDFVRFIVKCASWKGDFYTSKGLIVQRCVSLDVNVQCTIHNGTSKIASHASNSDDACFSRRNLYHSNFQTLVHLD